MPIRTHYIPRFILKQFKDGSLWELDKATNTCERRDVELAAQHPDFYPIEVERKIMERWDTSASRVCRQWIFDNVDIRLVEKERRILSIWIALFFFRSPFNFRQMWRHVDAAASQHDELVVFARRRAISILSDISVNDPQKLAQAVSLFGRALGFQYLLYRVEQQIRSDPARYLPTPAQAFAEHIQSYADNLAAIEFGRNPAQAVDFAGFVHQMTWTWLHCPTWLGGWGQCDDTMARA